MAKTLYSFYKKSERAFICLEGHIHEVRNYEVSVEDDHYEVLLKEFPDQLSEVPWKNINNEWVKQEPVKENKTKINKEAE
jgi:hypothetical protein